SIQQAEAARLACTLRASLLESAAKWRDAETPPPVCSSSAVVSWALLQHGSSRVQERASLCSKNPYRELKLRALPQAFWGQKLKRTARGRCSSCVATAANCTRPGCAISKRRQMSPWDILRADLWK